MSSTITSAFLKLLLENTVGNLGLNQILLTNTHRTISLQHWLNLDKPREDTLKPS